MRNYAFTLPTGIAAGFIFGGASVLPFAAQVVVGTIRTVGIGILFDLAEEGLKNDN